MSNILKATHSGELKISEFSISCAVLENGTRILVDRSVSNAFGTKGSGAYWKKKREEKSALLPEYISAKYLQDFIPEEVRVKLSNPIVYINKSGKLTDGIPAECLLDICDIWINAYEKGALSQDYAHIAKNAQLLIRGLAVIGVVALIDEATGYQYDRSRNELQKILEAYVLNHEYLPWTKKFPDEFYEQLFRLRDWQYKPVPKAKPGYVGKLTNLLIYDHLPPKVLDGLKNNTPKSENGNYLKRYWQSLTPTIGEPHLDKQLASVITLMKISPNWRIFQSNFAKAFPKGQLELDLNESE